MQSFTLFNTKGPNSFAHIDHLIVIPVAIFFFVTSSSKLSLNRSQAAANRIFTDNMPPEDSTFVRRRQKNRLCTCATKGGPVALDQSV